MQTPPYATGVQFGAKGGQVWQVAPPPPQVSVDCSSRGTQVPPEQQPVGQLAGEHDGVNMQAPPLGVGPQASEPGGHGRHAMPPLPQLVGLC
jgi:hypothetical protein